MTLIRPSTDYTTKDFDSIRTRLFNILPSAFPEWTDEQIADFGNLLVEMFAFVGDVLLYYQDNQANESRWSTAILRRSILSMLKLVPYKPHGASAASASLMVKLAAIPTANVVIAAGDTFSTADAAPVVFQVLQTATIAAGTNPPLIFVTVENSVAASDLVTSTELASQRYTLGTTPFLDGSLTVSADNGGYLLVDDFLNSDATDRHAVLSVDENNRATVAFGDGVAGQIPTGAIVFTYKTGGGSTGNVAQNSIVRVPKTYTDVAGVPVTLTVTNPAKAGGGDDLQTVESIRERAPRSIRAPSRTICREDYEINALRVPGVSRALMLTKDELSSIYENQGTLYIVPAGGGQATEALLQAVYEMITVQYPKGITFKVAILSARYLKVDIVTKVHFRTGVKKNLVADNIRKALVKFFAIQAVDGSDNANVDFGFYLDGAIAWSDVFNEIRDTSGVRKIDDGLGNLTINGEADDLTVAPFLFPVLGQVTIIDAETGTAL